MDIYVYQIGALVHILKLSKSKVTSDRKLAVICINLFIRLFYLIKILVLPHSTHRSLEHQGERIIQNLVVVCGEVNCGRFLRRSGLPLLATFHMDGHYNIPAL